MLSSLPSEKIWNTFVSRYNPAQSLFSSDRHIVFQKWFETLQLNASDELLRSLVSAGDFFDFLSYCPTGLHQSVLEIALHAPEKPLYKEIVFLLCHHGCEIFFLKDFIQRFWPILSKNSDPAALLLEKAFEYKNPQPWFFSFLDKEKKEFLHRNAGTLFSNTLLRLFVITPKYATDDVGTPRFCGQNFG